MSLDYCSNCGVKNDDGGRFCGNCGQDNYLENKEQNPISPQVDNPVTPVSNQPVEKPQYVGGLPPPSNQQYQPYLPNNTHLQSGPEFIPPRNYNLVFLATLFIPGIAFYYAEEKNLAYGLTIGIYILYFFSGTISLLAVLGHFYLIVTSISKVKKFDQYVTINPKFQIN